GEIAEAVQRPRLTHQPEARVRPAVALERYQPGEAAGRHLAAQMHLDVGRTVERLLQLRALDEAARHAEPELPVEAVVGAAGEDARPRGDRLTAVDGDRHAAGVDRNRSYARAAAQLGPGAAARAGQRLIEARA